PRLARATHIAARDVRAGAARAARGYLSSWDDCRMRLLIRALLTAAALAVATALVPGIELGHGSTTSKVLTLLAVAVIFGLVNAVIKPVVKAVGCLFYVLTPGLFGRGVNALLSRPTTS